MMDSGVGLRFVRIPLVKCYTKGRDFLLYKDRTRLYLRVSER